MCLVGIAWQSHPQFPLVIAANRDELHARPSAAADWWADAPEIYGGRDLEANGTWFAINRAGHFAAVTNLISNIPYGQARISRGHLISDYLRGALEPAEYLQRLTATHAEYRPFRLVAGSHRSLFIATSFDENHFEIAQAQPGLFALTNSPPGETWAKADWIQAELEARIAAERIDGQQLIGALATRRVARASDGDMQGNLAHQYAPFIRNRQYGTRASTVLVVDGDGEVHFVEKRYGPDGDETGESTLRFRPAS